MNGPGCPEKGSDTRNVKQPGSRWRLFASGCWRLLVFVPISGSHDQVGNAQVGNELENGLQSKNWLSVKQAVRYPLRPCFVKPRRVVFARIP